MSSSVKPKPRPHLPLGCKRVYSVQVADSFSFPSHLPTQFRLLCDQAQSPVLYRTSTSPGHSKDPKVAMRCRRGMGIGESCGQCRADVRFKIPTAISRRSSNHALRAGRGGFVVSSAQGLWTVALGWNLPQLGVLWQSTPLNSGGPVASPSVKHIRPDSCPCDRITPDVLWVLNSPCLPFDVRCMQYAVLLSPPRRVSAACLYVGGTIAGQSSCKTPLQHGGGGGGGSMYKVDQGLHSPPGGWGAEGDPSSRRRRLLEGGGGGRIGLAIYGRFHVQQLIHWHGSCSRGSRLHIVLPSSCVAGALCEWLRGQTVWDASIRAAWMLWLHHAGPRPAGGERLHVGLLAGNPHILPLTPTTPSPPCPPPPPTSSPSPADDPSMAGNRTGARALSASICSPHQGHTTS